MAQSVLMSWAESCANSLSALVLGFALNVLVLPLFNLHPRLTDSAWMALIFFLASVLRNMAWRRYFESRNEG
jgi:hypothetical protein